MNRPTAPSPALRLEFDAEALQSNWRTLDRLSGRARAGAAVKANSYGVGAVRAVPVLHQAGCRDFFVAHWAEAAEILDVIGDASLSVLHGPCSEEDAAYARAAGIKPVINSLRQARLWQDAGGGACDLMVDTGMNRLGVSLHELGEPVLAELQVDTLLSHLVSAEEDVALNERQRQGWREACAALPHQRASLANSAGIALGEAFHGDLTRPGIALYGGVPRPEMAADLHPVIRPQAALLQVRQVQPGETIGYNATFTATRAMRVGTIGLGYADGYLRCWSGKGHFTAGGHVLPVLGRISMDLTVVDLSQAGQVGEGDWITAEYALPEAAAQTGLSQYELLTLMGRRFNR